MQIAEGIKSWMWYIELYFWIQYFCNNLIDRRQSRILFHFTDIFSQTDKTCWYHCSTRTGLDAGSLILHCLRWEIIAHITVEYASPCKSVFFSLDFADIEFLMWKYLKMRDPGGSKIRWFLSESGVQVKHNLPKRHYFYLVLIRLWHNFKARSSKPGIILTIWSLFGRPVIIAKVEKAMPCLARLLPC